MVKILEIPKSCEFYTQIGTYQNNPIYISNWTPVETVAHLADDAKSICLNRKVYEILQKSPKFLDYLTTICEHEKNNPPYHVIHETWSEKEEEVLQYLKASEIIE